VQGGGQDPRGWIGSELDRYALEALIGEGGFGAVFRARHVVTGKTMAVKVLLPAQSSMAERFLQEAKAAAAVGNKHIVDVTDAGRAPDGRYFLAMELLNGESLEEILLRETALPVERAVAIAQQLLHGLEAAHGKGIVHRDLKPANIFLVRDSEGADFVKILDFGISKMRLPNEAALVTRPGEVLGTPHYMAPEQFQGSAHTDHRTDVYGAAMVLYEMLSGSRAFDDATYERLIIRVCTEPAVPLVQRAPHVPSEVGAVVDRGLAKHPDQRWATAGEMAQALARLGGSARGIPPTAVASEWARPGMSTDTPIARTMATPGAGTFGAPPSYPSASSAGSGALMYTPHLGHTPHSGASSSPHASGGGSRVGLILVAVGAMLVLGLGVLGLAGALLLGGGDETTTTSSTDGTTGTGGAILPANAPDAGGAVVQLPDYPGQIPIANQLRFTGCDADFSGRITTSGMGTMLNIVSMLGSYIGGTMTIDPKGQTGPIELSTRHRIDTQVIVNLTTSTTWTNLSSNGVTRRDRDQIKGTLTIGTWDLRNMKFDLTFDGVVLENVSDNTTCRIDGRIRSL
jgi:serine/threonine-protein kinase